MEHFVDVSQLQPPAPLGIVLDRVRQLPRGDYLHIRHSREPFPLYAMLADMGFAWIGAHRGDGFEMRVWRRDDEPAPPFGVN